jgi:hypothetical protein
MDPAPREEPQQTRPTAPQVPPAQQGPVTASRPVAPPGWEAPEVPEEPGYGHGV